MSDITIFTKEALIKKLLEISEMGWVKNARRGNHGGVGNTLEDLLGIEENNLPIPNASEWELKCQRDNTTALTTLFHIEPSPRAVKFVPSVLLPKYGWPHKEAGKKHPSDEMSFRQTIGGENRSDRGFKVVIDRNSEKVLISFDASSVDDRHKKWLAQVSKKVGLGELTPQPYWGFKDLEHKAGTKLLNCFYVQAKVKREKRTEYYRYNTILMLKEFSFENFLKAIESNIVKVDFDSRTGHNHGTKFRMRQNHFPMLYKEAVQIK